MIRIISVSQNIWMELYLCQYVGTRRQTGPHLETNNTDVMTKARRAVPRTTETTTTARREPANTPANVWSGATPAAAAMETVTHRRCSWSPSVQTCIWKRHQQVSITVNDTSWNSSLNDWDGQIAGSWIYTLHQTGDNIETMHTLTVRSPRCPPYTHYHTLQRQNEQLWCVLCFLWHPCSFVSSVGRVGAVTFAADGGKLINDISFQTGTLRIAFYRGANSGVPITRIRFQITDIFTFMWSKHKTAVWENTFSPPDSLIHSFIRPLQGLW